MLGNIIIVRLIIELELDQLYLLTDTNNKRKTDKLLVLNELPNRKQT